MLFGGEGEGGRENEISWSRVALLVVRAERCDLHGTWDAGGATREG